MKEKIVLPAKCFTHAGSFHADDVFSTALLKIIRPDIQVIRGFKVPKDFDGIVFDIGGGAFDHHKVPREARDNGVPYAAFGKLWRVYGPKLVGEHQAKWLDSNFVQGLDDADNGGHNNPLSGAIAGMNPFWNSDEDVDECFDKAVKMAKEILERQIESCLSRNAAMAIRDKVLVEQKGPIVVIEEYAPIVNELSCTGKMFVVFPSNRGGWNAQVVPVTPTSRIATLPFPTAWWGSPKELLPDGVTFCHASGFMIAADTKEAAIKACELAIKKFEKKNNKG